MKKIFINHLRLNKRELAEGISESLLSKIFIVLVLVILFSSCKDFLNISSPNDVADQDAITSKDGLLSARIGMYNALQNDAYYGGYFPLMIDAYSDNGAAGGYDAPQLNQFNEKALGADNIFIDNFWIAAYNVIYTANKILDQVEVISDPALTQEVRSDIRGEALTIRALVHFDLLRTFGEHWNVNSEFGIPLQLQASDPTEIIGRSTVKTCYDAIESDLISALYLVSDDDVEYETGAKTAMYVSRSLVKGLLARLYLYEKRFDEAANMAGDVIDNGNFNIVADPASIYSSKLNSESIFELLFNVQDQSQYNNLTYVRGDALRVDVAFLANASLNEFFLQRPEDARSSLVDFSVENNDGSIQPDGRTQKYRGEETRDNSAYIMRFSELYYIRAEAFGSMGNFSGCRADLQTVADARGAVVIPVLDLSNFQSVIQDERRAELNFEGHRYFDLARIEMVKEVIGADVLPVFPIPANQVSVSGGVISQYPGY